MALSMRTKNLIMGGGLGAFAFGVFAYTMKQMSKVRFSVVAVSSLMVVSHGATNRGLLFPYTGRF
jgi:hypothetical protein